MTEHLMLTVQLHGQPIGTITHLGGERTLFAFNGDYIANHTRPTLGLRFKDAFGALITDFRPYKIRLMPFFSNLLPEGPLRQHLAQKANVHADREFFLLRALGQDLPGAITVRGEGRETTSLTPEPQPGGSANHIEDFAQVFDVYPEDKYKTASMRDIAAEAGQDDIAELIRRLTFNVLIGNGDMHLKNWSLIYPDQRRAKLAPAYDFVSTIAYIENDKSALKFSRSKDFADFTMDELTHLCAKAALPFKLVKDTATETVAAFMEHWAAEKSHLPMVPNVTRAIDRHLQKLPIVRDTNS